MFRYVALLLISVQAVAQPLADDIADALARGQALYYEARFKDSIDILARADEQLRSRPDRLQDKINVKLQLALSNIGLNDGAQAKTFLREVYGLDPDYILDTQQFSPKVLQLAGEAKNEQNDIRCQAVREDIRKKLDAGNAQSVLDTLNSMRARCAGLSSFEPDLAELLYKTGLDSYKRGDLLPALQNFRSAVKLAPKHELAAQYVELTQSKLQVDADKSFLQWKQNGEPRQVVKIAAPVETPKPPSGCIQMNVQLAMARLKTRVNPDLPPALQNFLRGAQMTVRVKARIDESGNVTVNDVQGSNPGINEAVRSAVERWKFSPIIDASGTRCVDTEIPIVFGPQTTASAR